MEPYVYTAVINASLMVTQLCSISNVDVEVHIQQVVMACTDQG